MSACLAAFAGAASPADAAAPVQLLVSPSTAFTVLGHWCGGIREQGLRR